MLPDLQPTPTPDPYARLRARVRIGTFEHVVMHGVMYLETHAWGRVRSMVDPATCAQLGTPTADEVLAVLEAMAAAVDEVREVHRIDGVRGLQSALDQARAELGGGRS